MGFMILVKKEGYSFYKNNHNFTCMLKDSLINSKERFCSLLNIPLTNTSFESISDVEYRDFLSEQLKRVPPYLLAGFFHSNKEEIKRF